MLIHSRVVGFIHYPSPLDDLSHKAVTHLNSFLYLLASTHEQIQGHYANGLYHVAENYRRLSERASLEWHYNQQINIRPEARVAIGVRTKEHDFVGMKLARYLAAHKLDLIALQTSGEL